MPFEGLRFRLYLLLVAACDVLPLLGGKEMRVELALTQKTPTAG